MISHLPQQGKPSARAVRLAFVRLITLVLAFALVVPAPLTSVGVAPRADVIVSMPSDTGKPRSADPSDSGLVCHAQCGCHQAMRSEPTLTTLVLRSERVSFFERAAPLSPLAPSPPRKPPRLA